MVGKRALQAPLTAVLRRALPLSAVVTWLTVAKLPGERPLRAAVVAVAGGVPVLAVGAPPLPRRRRLMEGLTCPPWSRQRGWLRLVVTGRLRLRMAGT